MSVILKHFVDFVTHNTMHGLSGGQKVKIVLGGRRPHIICFDERTNYLQGPRQRAARDGGGVLVITHNRNFSESPCKEVWAMRDGRLEASGHNRVKGQVSGPRIDKGDDDEDQYDEMSNKIDKGKGKK